jgi:PAS domain S-box-containing protein
MTHDDPASEAHWHRTLLAHVSEGAILIDRDGRLIYANPAAARLFQPPSDGFAGAALTALFHEDDRDGVAARLADVSRTDGEFALVTCRAQAPGGAPVWIELKLRHDREAGVITGTCVDVTALRQARQSPTASQPRAAADARWARRAVDKLWLAIEQTADSVVITDREGVIEYVNPAFETMSGYAREDVIGRTPNVLRSGVQGQRFYENLWNTILSGRTFRATMTNRRRDGTLYDEDQTITPIRDESGMVTHFVSTGRDITQRNRAQEALRRLNHQLETEATRIAGTLHDEAGQFLTAIHITLADVARDVEPGVRERLNEVRRHLDLIEERLRRVAHEMHPRVVEDLGLAEAVAFFAESFTHRTGVRVRVTSSIEARYPLAVETLLYRVVQEGLTNVSRHARASNAVVTLGATDESLHCSIEDDGVGFDVVLLMGAGDSGLGLRLMRDRLDAVGGTLTVDSTAGRGTHLRATVPVEV